MSKGTWEETLIGGITNGYWGHGIRMKTKKNKRELKWRGPFIIRALGWMDEWRRSSYYSAQLHLALQRNIGAMAKVVSYVPSYIDVIPTSIGAAREIGKRKSSLVARSCQSQSVFMYQVLKRKKRQRPGSLSTAPNVDFIRRKIERKRNKGR